MHSDTFKNKSILITGGTGSFGQALARRLLEEDECSKVIIFSRDEWKQESMRQSEPIFNHHKIRYFLGDVRDASRLKRAFNEVQIVVHAAALKQVPAAEYNPTEFIKTNIIGAMNVIDAAIDNGVEKVIALSTDKSVNPVNLYGATKLCSDKLFIAGNSYVGARGYPTLSVVRYGNVSGSRGSIIPLWCKLAHDKAEALSITHPDMTRFWITLEQSVTFVMNCIAASRGGEIFVPKIPSIRLTDLAKAIAPEMAIKISGIRPGEKIHELLISSEESRHTVEIEDHFVIMPEMSNYVTKHLDRLLNGRKGKRLPEDYCYASNTNIEWLNVAQLTQLVQPFLDHN